jgi:hypothetical protein
MQRSHLVSGLIVFLLALLFCLCPGPFCALVGGQMVAFGVVPDYPAATLISTDREWQSNTVTEKHIYRTNDSLDTVLIYMEQHLPGFVKVDLSPLTQVAPKFMYRNSLHPSWLTKLAFHYAELMHIARYEADLPYMNVLIYSDPSDPSGTIIEVISGWWTG